MSEYSLNLPQERIFAGPARLWKRGAAFVIDLLIIHFFIISPFEGILQRLAFADAGFREAYSMLSSSPQSVALLSAISLFIGLFAMCYLVACEYVVGRTVGKMLLNIGVIAEERKQLTLWQAVVRNVFIMPVFPFVLLWVIDPLSMLFTQGGRRLSEVLTRTRTVELFTLT
ncbi:TPA: RDD family protein [Candidatus Woesearchaeota archaeon]|nr:RDD family protein [Candidatus Woesearchaeota archaeon]